MSKQINPAVGIAIGIVIVIIVGFISFKTFGKPSGVSGPIPDLYKNPTGAPAPEPAGAVKGGGANR